MGCGRYGVKKRGNCPANDNCPVYLRVALALFGFTMGPRLRNPEQINWWNRIAADLRQFN